jgi:putative NADH-flavin reductase
VYLSNGKLKDNFAFALKLKEMKKIIVFGATGGTGRQVVELALQRGFEVTVIVRNPAAFTVQHSHLKVVKGDVLQPFTFKNEISENDIVISCLGIPKVQQTTLYSESMKNMVAVMQASGASRILCISSGAVSVPPDSSFIMTFLLKNVLQRIYKPVYTDMRLMEKIIHESGLNWTIVRAPKLTDGKRTEKYKDITNQPLRSIPTISRADLADYMLNQISEMRTYQSRVDIAY